MTGMPLAEVPTTRILALGRPTIAGTTEAIGKLRPLEVRATVFLSSALGPCGSCA